MALLDSSHKPADGWVGKVGIPGGIPTDYTMFCNVRVSIPGYGGAVATGDGVTDDSAAINAAVNLCPNGQYVYIPEGSYWTTGIGRGGANNYDYVSHPFSILIRGDGPTKTKLYNHAPYGQPSIAFGSNSGVTANIVSGNTRGSTQIVWDNNPGYAAVGGMMVILRENSESGFDEQPDNITYMHHACSQVVKITAINGNTVTFTPALNEGYPSDSIGIPISCPFRCGIEDLYIERMEDINDNGINIFNGIECWVKNVESRMCRRWHICLQASLFCEVRECYVHETWEGGGSSGYGVCIYQWSCNNLIENNRMWRCRHSMIFEWGGQGNVFGYNYSLEPVNEVGPSGEYPIGYANDPAHGDFTVVPGKFTSYMMGDMTTHGGNPRYNLFEGNRGCILRFDNILGGSNFITAHRNHVMRRGMPTTVVARFGRDIQRNSLDTYFSGNVFAAPETPWGEGINRWGSTDDDISDNDARVFASAIIDGDFDAEADAETWVGSPHSLPDSYYLTAKPAWWDAAAWPEIGTDLSEKFGSNPAYRRSLGSGGAATPVAGAPRGAALMMTF